MLFRPTHEADNASAKQSLFGHGVAQRPITVDDVVATVKVFAMIRRNVSVTLLPQLSVPDDDGSLNWVAISGERLVRTVGIHRRAGVAFSPTTGAFADVLSRYVAEQLEIDQRIWAPSTL